MDQGNFKGRRELVRSGGQGECKEHGNVWKVEVGEVLFVFVFGRSAQHAGS